MFVSVFIFFFFCLSVSVFAMNSDANTDLKGDTHTFSIYLRVSASVCAGYYGYDE